MKSIFVLTALFLVNFNICAVDRQIALVLSVDTDTEEYTINLTDESTAGVSRFYDNVISYKMKYFLDTGDAINYASFDGAVTAALGVNDFLYSFNRDNSGSSYLSPDPYTDGGALVTETLRFTRYYPITFMNKKVDYAYIAFNIVPDCTGITGTASSPPFLNFSAKFFCSDEEAKAEYDQIIADANQVLVSIALVTTNGDCTSQEGVTNQDDYSSALVATVTICDLLEGQSTALCVA